ncbi:YcaO-like family protein [uncultured Friedmanniella sp.]|uniref:YcaO-like family protein n=1 Tax=uncultured Friedmanniella sp. TaxID=335381 RepID=UPI0035CC1F21
MADSLTAFADVLAGFGEVLDLDISSLDRIGVPVTSCSLLSGGEFVAHGNGYGADLDAARLSGLGELAEGVLAAAAVERLRPRARQACYAELVAQLGTEGVADPRTLCLPAGSAYVETMPRTWLPMTRVRTGGEVWVPVELVASEPGDLASGYEPLLTPITNGLGAGLDPVRPLTHGLLEILQRHTNGLRFRALDSRSPEIDRAGLPASVAALVARVEQSGVELVLKHAASELGVCSTYVMGVDPTPGSKIQVTACGEAAHPSAEVSLTKAVLEYANSRVRKTFAFGPAERSRPLAPDRYWAALGGAGEVRATEAMRVWRDLSTEDLSRLTGPDRRHHVDYDSILTGGAEPQAGQPLLDHVLESLAGRGSSAGHDVLAATITVGEVNVAKVVVSGLEVETLSYGRIGEANARDLLGTDLDLVRRQDGPSVTHPDRIVLTTEAEERLGGPVWYSYAAAAHLVGPLYPLYREPGRHTVTVVDA